MTTRKKTAAVLPPTDLTGAEKVMAAYADADAKLEQITSKMDEEIVKIREAKAAELQELTEKRDTAFKQLQMFGESHPDLFPKKKSYNMTQGVIGFRTGTPKLKTLKGFTWASSLKLLGVDELGKSYIKTVEQPMKDKLLADRENNAVKLLLPEVGLEVVQDETFYIELKKEEVDG